MRVVVGHANPDFDAYASTVAGTKLFPGAKGIFLGSQNANVRAFHNLHEEFLDFADYKQLDSSEIDAIVMVDTRDPDRLPAFGEVARRDAVEVIVYDHHPRQSGDIETAEDRSLDVGATTTILVREIRDHGIGITPLEASVMLLGIHEDTGSLTFPNATALDADAAAWLMDNGADLEVLSQYLGRTLDAAQTDLLEQLTSSLERWDINGETVAVGVAEAAEYVDSAGVLTHYVVEDLGFRVAFAVVRMPGRVQVVARSRLAQVDVGAVMARFGGGGHPQAASARFGPVSTAEVLGQLRGALEEQLAPPVRAADVMTAPVRHATPSWTMRRAGELMATWGHGGLPVLQRGKLVGLVTRKDVDKATRHGLDHAPVTGFMNRDMIIVSPLVVLSELERLLGTRGVGRLPVVEDGKLLGIVTRKDVLRAEHGDAYLAGRVAGAHPEATARFRTGVQALLPGEVSSALHLLGEHAASRGHRAFVVGGFVRDMILGVENLDVDVVIEGDGVAFAEELAAEIGARIKVHRRFGTAVIGVSERFHIDVASARTEYYTRPGALPVVERSSLRQDLFRRDFSINAMAASLEPTAFGVVSDPFAGLRDLDDRVVRVLHGLSYVDDPTRVLRAVRFESRYGFRMDEGTERLARQAINAGMLAEVSGARLREELIDILGEREPTDVLARLAELGALPTLLPEGARADRVASTVGEAQRAFEAIAGRICGNAPSLTRTLFCSLCAGVSERSVLMWARHLHANRSFAERALQLAEKGPSVLRMLEQPKAVRDSRLYRALEPLHAETLVVVWALAGAQGRARMDRFFDELTGVRSAVSGADLIAMGATPSDAFSAILARALDDRLDGRTVGRKAELTNLRRLAVRAGVLTNRKDRA
jgi:tRNA nucleotidyltransferase (CCA-adding enzyme)